MKIGGYQKTSLLDYPECISAIVWTNGCNFRCPFCYNKKLVLGTAPSYPEDEILSYLSKRKGLLDGVVISGGEPLLQEDLILFIEKVKKRGYLVKIDTNGTYPEKLTELLENKLVDYVAMDIKAPKLKYHQLAGVKVDLDVIDQSISLIKTKAPEYEFRTTVIPELLTVKDIVDIAQWIQGSKRWYLQQFRINPPLVSSKMEKMIPYSKEYFLEMKEAVKPYVPSCNIRGI